MFKLRLGLILVTLVAAVAFADEGIFDTDSDQPPPIPKSVDARDALQKYDAAAKAADEDCVKARLLADQKLISELRAAMTKATRDGDLDDANAIKAQIAVAEQRANSEKPPKPAGVGLVQVALYGPEGKETADVTAIIKRCVNNNTLAWSDLKLPDVAAFQHKSLLIEGTYNGAPYAIRIGEGGLHLFRFGAPPKK